MYVLEKKLGKKIVSYFKGKDKTGHTYTILIDDAMSFDKLVDAIDYNYKILHCECIAISK